MPLPSTWTNTWRSTSTRWTRATPHITLADDLDDAEFDKLVKVCPAALYKRDEDGARSFDYAGCLECGTCRVLCEGTVVSKWKFPEATMGVEYRFG